MCVTNGDLLYFNISLCDFTMLRLRDPLLLWFRSHAWAGSMPSNCCFYSCVGSPHKTHTIQENFIYCTLGYVVLIHIFRFAS